MTAEFSSSKRTVFRKPQNMALVYFLSLKAMSFSAFFCTQALAKPVRRRLDSGCDHALSPACSNLKSFEMLFIVCTSILSIVLAKSCCCSQIPRFPEAIFTAKPMRVGPPSYATTSSSQWTRLLSLPQNLRSLISGSQKDYTKSLLLLWSLCSP